jgi:hypothetical protein
MEQLAICVAEPRSDAAMSQIAPAMASTAPTPWVMALARISLSLWEWVTVHDSARGLAGGLLTRWSLESAHLLAGPAGLCLLP